MISRPTRLRALKQQIHRLHQRLQRLQTLHYRFSWYRLAFFLVAALIAFSLFLVVTNLAGWIAILVGLTIFNIIAFQHRRLERGITRHKKWLDIKLTHLARMTLDWHNIPASAAGYALNENPLKFDLDLTGKNSLHQLIDISISSEGSDLLEQWLSQAKPEPEQIHQRQKIIRELIPLTRFRDKLLLIFSMVSEQRLEGKKLLRWLTSQSVPASLKWVLVLSAGLALVNITLFILSSVGLLPPYWVLAIMSYSAIYFMNQARVGSIFAEVVHLDAELTKFATILNYLENYPYGANNNLAKLCEPFLAPGKRPSIHLNKVKRIAVAIGLRMNPLVGVALNAIVPWDFYFAFRLNKCQVAIAELLPAWFRLWGELEALISLANFAWLNPDYVFPTILPEKDSTNPFFFDAKALGHPLINNDQKICNDFALTEPGQMVIITGSNMSGKSTFLKTLGINFCLAYAGSVVNAASLQTSLFRLFTCIKINDSVTGGFSYFYAEVRRLRQLLTELESQHQMPLFFLIDEIFKGTNNRERLIGSQSYIRALAGHQGLGVVSTHDLELVKLADAIPTVKNFHFREEVIDGTMVFDFKLRPGPCPTTNALKIMRLEGLPVEIEETRNKKQEIRSKSI